VASHTARFILQITYHTPHCVTYTYEYHDPSYILYTLSGGGSKHAEGACKIGIHPHREQKKLKKTKSSHCMGELKDGIGIITGHITQFSLLVFTDGREIWFVISSLTDTVCKTLSCVC
jgi:hypothetical protein